MKLIRTMGEKVGLFVPLAEGPRIIDIVGSLSVLEHDPLSNGILNGALKGGCDWLLIVKHWAHLRLPLKKLMNIAMANPDHPGAGVAASQIQLQGWEYASSDRCDRNYGRRKR